MRSSRSDSHPTRWLWLIAMIGVCVVGVVAEVGGPSQLPAIEVMIPLAIILGVLGHSDRRGVAPTAGAVIAWWTWMVIFGHTTDALEGTRFDLLAMFDRLPGRFDLLAKLLAGFGVAIAVGAATHRILTRRLVPPPPDHCEECGYDLTGISAKTCPECGRPIVPN